MKTIPNAPLFNNDFVPLQITVQLASPPVFYQSPLSLDALLAYAVVQRATYGQGLPKTIEPYNIPLPIEKLWECPETGLPLWDATQFHPVEANTRQPAYWHKRGYNPQLLKTQRNGRPHNANFGQGRHKEYRMPLPLQTAKVWRAFCVGNLSAIGELLKSVSAIGKKRSQGYGKILNWEITEVSDFPYGHEGRLIKSFPIGSSIPELPSGTIWDMYETGWTPPYWFAPIFKTCFV